VTALACFCKILFDEFKKKKKKGQKRTLELLPECPQKDNDRTTVTPGVSIGTSTIDCCL
jgi:hypothetical protein